MAEETGASLSLDRPGDTDIIKMELPPCTAGENGQWE